jgi:hypothetical protein
MRALTHLLLLLLLLLYAQRTQQVALPTALHDRTRKFVCLADKRLLVCRRAYAALSKEEYDMQGAVVRQTSVDDHTASRGSASSSAHGYAAFLDGAIEMRFRDGSALLLQAKSDAPQWLRCLALAATKDSTELGRFRGHLTMNDSSSSSSSSSAAASGSGGGSSSKHGKLSGSSHSAKLQHSSSLVLASSIDLTTSSDSSAAAVTAVTAAAAESHSRSRGVPTRSRREPSKAVNEAELLPALQLGLRRATAATGATAAATAQGG